MSELDLDGIFLRPLSPYGFAIKTKQFEGSDAKWLDFYQRGLRYIIDVNRRGHPFSRILRHALVQADADGSPMGYVDLRSPAGIGLGALVYNYDGKVFASDEGRMLAEMGDRTFELGDLGTDYRSLIMSDKLIGLVSGTLAQCAPQCQSCAYEPHCGADPVYHHATQGDPVGIKPLSGFCARQKGICTNSSKCLKVRPKTPQCCAVGRAHDAACANRVGDCCNRHREVGPPDVLRCARRVRMHYWMSGMAHWCAVQKTWQQRGLSIQSGGFARRRYVFVR